MAVPIVVPQLIRSPQAPIVGPDLLRSSNAGGFGFVNPWASSTLAAGVALQLQQGLRQLWSYLNQRPGKENPDYEPLLNDNINATLPPPGNLIGATLTLQRSDGQQRPWFYLQDGTCINPIVQDTNDFGLVTFLNVFKAAVVAEPATQCGSSVVLEYYRTDTPTVRRTRSIISSTYGISEYTNQILVNWAGPNPFTFQPSVQGWPEAEGFFQPEVIPKPLTLPELVPPAEPRPITTPAPLTEPDPGRRRIAPPITRPSTTPWEPYRRSEPLAPPTPGPGPSPTPFEPGPADPPPLLPPAPPIPKIPTPKTPQKIGPDGLVIPAPQAGPTPTPQSDKAIGPVTIKTGAGSRPRPTPEGTARELARLEAKLEILLNPQQQAPDWIERIKDLLDLLTVLSTGNTYTMVEVCPPDGQPPEEYEWEVPGVPVLGLGLAARLDALAEMLQVHKNLKQPVCRTVPQGQPVQVQFIQSETEWEAPP